MMPDVLIIADTDAMMPHMRTTLTIEDQVMHELKEVAHRRRKPLKAVVNEALRQGLKHLRQPAAPKKYKSPAFSLGHPPTINLDKALTIASALEDDEISRKLTAPK
jgi:hypothetical protein